MTVEQARTQAFLERADLPADGRLAEFQLLAGVGEAARLGNGVEDAEFVPIHGWVGCSLAGIVEATGGGRAAAYCAAASALSCSLSDRNFSASSAPMQPSPAAVTAWRNTLSLTSPAAKIPGTLVAVLSGAVRI